MTSEQKRLQLQLQRRRNRLLMRLHRVHDFACALVDDGGIAQKVCFKLSDAIAALDTDTVSVEEKEE